MDDETAETRDLHRLSFFKSGPIRRTYDGMRERFHFEPALLIANFFTLFIIFMAGSNNMDGRFFPGIVIFSSAAVFMGFLLMGFPGKLTHVLWVVFLSMAMVLLVFSAFELVEKRELEEANMKRILSEKSCNELKSYIGWQADPDGRDEIDAMRMYIARCT